MPTTNTLDRIAGPENIPNGAGVLFAGAGAGNVYTIKNMKIVNNTAGTITVSLGINGVTDPDLILPAVAIGPGEWAEWDGVLTLDGTDTIESVADATGLTFTASGLAQS